MTKIINTTPHSVNIVDADNNIIRTIVASGNTVRLSQRTEVIGELDGLRLTKTVYGDPVYVSGDIQGPMPAEQDGVYYLVSAMVKSAMDRKDLLVPAEQVRDEAGRIVGCRSLGL